MSLDVYLYSKDEVERPVSSGIFVRESGKTIELTEEEWRERNPNREPMRLANRPAVTTEIYHDNITHNLAKMADEADLYYALWHPDERGWTEAHHIIPVLTTGLADLKSNPDHFKKLNPENGWGDYDGLVRFTSDYLLACTRHPEAKIGVSI